MIAWRPATLADIEPMIVLSQRNFGSDIGDIFTLDMTVSARNLTQAVVQQHYKPLTELVSVGCDRQNNIIAWTWARANDVAPWSDEPMVMARMAAVEMTLPSRTRLTAVADMLALWEGFARFAGISIICSSTMRSDYKTFMRLHESAGYTVRGSNAYKKLTKEQK